MAHCPQPQLFQSITVSSLPHARSRYNSYNTPATKLFDDKPDANISTNAQSIPNMPTWSIRHLPIAKQTFWKRESEISNTPAIVPGQFYSIIVCIIWWSRSNKREEVATKWKREKGSFWPLWRTRHPNPIGRTWKAMNRIFEKFLEKTVENLRERLWEKSKKGNPINGACKNWSTDIFKERKWNF